MTNYDFKANWSIIVEQLKTPYFRNLIENAIKKYVNDPNMTVDLPYANYARGDSYAMYCEKLNEKYIRKLLKEKKIPKTYMDTDVLIKEIKELKGIDADEEDDTFCDYVFEKEEKILSQAPHILNWRDDINAYKFYEMCFFINPTVSLELAKKICPNEKWIVELCYFDDIDGCTNGGHATVKNEDGSKYFDIVFMNEFNINEVMKGNCLSCNKKHPYETVIKE